MLTQQRVKIFVLVIALLVAAGAILSDNLVSAKDSASHITKPVLGDVDIHGQQSQSTVGGITIRLVGFRQAGENFQVEMCYTQPDERDWLLANRGDEITLSMQGKVIYPIEVGTIEWIISADGTENERCEYVLFPVIVDKEATNVQLSVRKISVSPPESLDCPSIQKELDNSDTSIKISCHVGGGSSGIDILAKPNDMTEVAARETVYEVIIDARSGPWVFDIPPTSR